MLLSDHRLAKAIASTFFLLSVLASACRAGEPKAKGTPALGRAVPSVVTRSEATAAVRLTEGASPATPTPDQGPPYPVSTATENLTPEIVAFEVAPSDRLSFGEMVTVTWSVHNAVKVTLCFRYSAGEPWDSREEGGSCFTHLPANGSQTLSLTPYEGGESHYAHFWLEATGGRTDPHDPNLLYDPVDDRADVYVPLTCTDAWFMPNPPKWCPQGPPRSIEATAQAFENGVIVYVPLHDGTPPSAVTAYFHDTSRGENRYLTFMAIRPEEPDPGLVSPPGLFVPSSLFYPVWRGLRDGRYRGVGPLRDLMGWATGTPATYEQVTQQERGPAGHDPLYTTMPDGSTYRLKEGVWAVWK